MSELEQIEAALRRHLARLQAKEQQTIEDLMYISLIDYSLSVQEVGVRLKRCKTTLERLEGGGSVVAAVSRS